MCLLTAALRSICLYDIVLHPEGSSLKAPYPTNLQILILHPATQWSGLTQLNVKKTKKKQPTNL